MLPFLHQKMFWLVGNVPAPSPSSHYGHTLFVRTSISQPRKWQTYSERSLSKFRCCTAPGDVGAIQIKLHGDNQMLLSYPTKSTVTGTRGCDMRCVWRPKVPAALVRGAARWSTLVHCNEVEVAELAVFPFHRQLIRGNGEATATKVRRAQKGYRTQYDGGRHAEFGEVQGGGRRWNEPVRRRLHGDYHEGGAPHVLSTSSNKP